ncbi:lipoprotein BA_5634 family protein [Paenibacillus qinlingensis]|uniref:Uncharacterized protein n=1 Tax=Paenibacillus qinlingensis TaxID=1837343 RepID=A0ABU1NRT7_9BACL|nr:lipoprotein BA_5634 family protein [Paenibacillus qinlingensis]MDR6550153.1 hypothetical protein [Paenibacillus qinlingensis]
MKKWLSISVAVLLIILVGGWAVRHYLDRHDANGVVLVGDKISVQSDIEKQKNNLKSNVMYNVKLVEAEGQKVLVIDKETAKGLVKMALLQKITNSQNGDTAELTSLPEFGDKKGVLFAKTQKDQLPLINGNGMDFQYGGNVIIGPGRSFADMIAVVDSSTFLLLNGKELGLGVLQLKDLNQQFTTREVQTVTVK